MQEKTLNSEFPPDEVESDWSALREGQEVTVIEGGHAKLSGTIDAISSDAKMVWVRPTGPLSRRLFLSTDPAIIQPRG